MAEEKETLDVEGTDDGSESAKEGGKKSGLLIIIVLVLLVALGGGGGYFAYTKLAASKGDETPDAPAEVKKKEKEKEAKVVLFSMEPFVVNLSEPGRYLKVSMQFELSGDSDEKVVQEKMPILRDVIITLIGNQTFEYAASAEGKIQLKEDILLRTNRIFGKEVFLNLYFTEFVMQ